MAAIGEVPVASGGHGQARDDLTAQVLEWDKSIYHQIRRQAEKVDIDLVLGTSSFHEGETLGVVVNCGDLVGVDRIDRGFRTHHGYLRAW